MRKQILTGATALALAAGVTSGAMAFDQGTGSGSYLRGYHARGYGASHSYRSGRGSRFEGIRGYESWRHGGWGSGSTIYRGGYLDLGPLGFTAACGSPTYGRGYCGQGYSILVR